MAKLARPKGKLPDLLKVSPPLNVACFSCRLLEFFALRNWFGLVACKQEASGFSGSLFKARHFPNEVTYEITNPLALDYGADDFGLHVGAAHDRVRHQRQGPLPARH